MRDSGHLAWGLLVGLLLALAAWLGLLAGQLGHPHPNHQWIDAAYAHKREIANTTGSPKLIIGGGSSAMFGIDSQLMSTHTGLPTVNLAVNAGLGLPLILDRTLESVSPGDRVLLALEYPLYGYDGKINHVMNDYYLSHPSSLLDAWSLAHEALPAWRWGWLVMRESLQLVMGTSLSRVLQGYGGLPEGFRITGTYGPHHLDAHGDQTSSSKAQRESWMEELVVSDGPRNYGANHDPQAPGWQMLRHFQAQLAERNACLVLTPPAFLFDPHYRETPRERAFYDELPTIAAEYGLDYVGSPWDFMYSASDMFDTDYHLVNEARQANTLQLLQALAREENGCLNAQPDS